MDDLAESLSSICWGPSYTRIDGRGILGRKIDRKIEIKGQSHDMKYDTGYRIQDTGYRIHDTGYRIQDSEYRIQDADTGY